MSVRLPSEAGAKVALRDLESAVHQELSRMGLLYRLFGRVKATDSIVEKVRRKGYGVSGRELTDFIGIRVAVYFSDDAALVGRAVERIFEVVEEVRDDPDAVVFGPTRFNLVVRLPAELAAQCEVMRSDVVADTFEVQVRSVLSEGWHEVEHDLRYKARDDWGDHKDLDRALNGLLATVETCDWSMLQVFEELAWRHYKAGRYGSMLRSKMRVRLATSSLSSEVTDLLAKDRDFRRRLFRTDRRRVLRKILDAGFSLPLTSDNVVYICNRLEGRVASVMRLEPSPVSEVLDSHLGQEAGSTSRG